MIIAEQKMEKDLEDIEINHNDKSLIMKDELKILIENQSALNQNDIVSENDINANKRIEPVNKPPDGGVQVRNWIKISNDELFWNLQTKCF